MWTMWHRQNLDRTGKDRIRSDCSFRFADFTWFRMIWFSVSSTIQTGFPNFFQFVYDLISNKAPPLILNSCGTQRLLRGMRDKPNVAKITSPWLKIIGIRTRSCVLNSNWDFDLAMWSTKVDQFVNYGFQCASRASNGRSSRTLRSNYGFCRVFPNWLMKWYIPIAHLHPWWHYTTLADTAVKVTTRGFRQKREKKTPRKTLFFHVDFI